MSAYEVEQMDCVEVVEIVTDYLERRLSEEERVRLEAHLEECEGCEAYLAQMRQTVTALRGIGGTAPPAGLDDLIAAFRERRGR
ncbi:MAG TPA: zf-HC2 domain-containing protein [Solirubrobacterales bacterium]